MQSLPDMTQLMKLAASPAGQKLLAMLQSDKSLDLNKLARNASSGNMADVRSQLAGILASEEAAELLRQMEQGL